MPFLLRRGATPQLALDALNEAITRLQNAVGAHPSSPAAEYVKALPGVEAQLGNAFDRQWVTETLYTPRCWHLMGVAHLTLPEQDFQVFSTGDESELAEFERRQRVEIVRLGSANNAADHERRFQIERLEQMQADVNWLLNVFSKTPGTILVVDTNVLMHAYALDEISWKKNLKIARDETLRIMVPLAVVDELDRKKFEGGPSQLKKANDAIRSLRALRGDAGPDIPSIRNAKDGTVFTLEIPRDDIGRKRSTVTDDEVRDFALFAEQIIGRPAKVIMWDMGAELRCKRSDLDVVWLRDEERKQ
jgi:hypothetical protein